MPCTKVHIDEPCHVAWNSMQAHDQGRFCGQCQTPVIDFTNHSIEDIQQYFQANSEQQVCGRYHARHTSEATPWLDKVNWIEGKLRRTGLKKLSVMVIAALLFFSQCARRRHLQGKFAVHPQKQSSVTRSKG